MPHFCIIIVHPLSMKHIHATNPYLNRWLPVFELHNHIHSTNSSSCDYSLCNR